MIQDGSSCDAPGIPMTRVYCAAATAIVDEQEINSIKELRFLMDADIETLCRNIK